MSVLHFIFQGERPYNDDSLLSDSITLQQELLLEEIENTPVPDMNLTQIAEQVDDLNSSPISIEEASSPTHAQPSISTSPSNPTASQKSGTPLRLGSSTKGCLATKKKRIADIK
jgi:hypothetical protein